MDDMTIYYRWRLLPLKSSQDDNPVERRRLGRYGKLMDEETDLRAAIAGRMRANATYIGFGKQLALSFDLLTYVMIF